MKIYVTHSSGFDFINELYHPLRSSALNNLHNILLPHENGAEIHNSRHIIQECDLILAEVSYPSTGQGIELGCANVSGKPIVCLYKHGAKPSSSLEMITDTVTEYIDQIDMIGKITHHISDMIA